MEKLTLSEYEAIDRIKVDTPISLFIDKKILDKNEVIMVMNDKINNLVDGCSKEKIKLEMRKYFKGL